jgi:hypothetical protein
MASSSLSQYYLSSSTTSGTWGISTVPITGALTPLIVANVDSGASALTSIGFTFNFNDTDYGSASVTSDGWMQLGVAAATDYGNNLLDADTRVILAPWWDDLQTWTPPYGGVYQFVTGTAPNRVSVWHWYCKSYYGSSYAIEFQTLLYETSNNIEFRYLSGSVPAGTSAASVGVKIDTSVSTAGNLRSFLNTGYPFGGSATADAANFSNVDGQQYPGNTTNATKGEQYFFQFIPNYSASFKDAYGSDDSELWTPSQSGSVTLSDNIAVWLDAENTGSVLTASGDATYNYGYDVVDTFEDIQHGVPLGQIGADGRSHPRYAPLDLTKNINDRRSMWFWEESMQYTPDTTLTASAGAFQSYLPNTNANRAVFIVFKSLEYYYPGANEFNALYEYGANVAIQGYGAGIFVTGSSNLAMPIVPLYGGGVGDGYYLTGVLGPTASADSAQIFYQDFNTSNGGTGSKDGGIEWYAGELPLNTDGTALQEFYLGDNIGSSLRGMDWVFGELIILDGVPSTSDRQLVEGYLAWKWGLTASLPASHPYANSAPSNASDKLNFVADVYAPNYVTASNTYAYGVIRSEAGTSPLIAEIDISESSTAVAGIDYTRPSDSELTLSWGSSENSTKEFNVTFMSNSAYTASTFIPYIRTATAGTNVGTASYASSSIIYPGVIDFTATGSQVNEGSAQTVTINRISGSDGSLTASLSITGTAIENVHYTLTNLTQFHNESSAAFGGGESSYSFVIQTLRNPALTSSVSLDFLIPEIEYPNSGTQFYPLASIGSGSAYAFIMNNYDTGSLEILAPSYNIYTASMPITWSVDRYSGSDGPVTATIDLIASGGYGTGVFGTDYTGAYGAFPITLTWDDGSEDPETFSILTMKNPAATTGFSLSPYISSASVHMESDRIATSSAAWITYPGYAYLSVSPDITEIVEGGQYTLIYNRYHEYGLGGGLVGELTATLSFAGTAVSGTDYTFPEASPPKPTPQGYVSWDSGSSGNGFVIQTTDDAADEGNETIEVYLNTASGTIYKFFTTSSAGVVEFWTDSSKYAFNTGTLLDTAASYLTASVTIIDNESGSVNFSTVSASVAAPASITLAVTRTGGADFAATATIDQNAGNAAKGISYTGLPATVKWDDQDDDPKSFTILTEGSAWATGSTMGLYFSTLVNIETGSTTPTMEVTITNDVIEESTDAYPLISPDGTINNYRNAFTSYRNKGAIPFGKAIKGAFSLRGGSQAASSSLGGKKNG